ncbi:MAG TPA: DUF2493 domain-containing protein [Acidimicrobiales bacterium]|nr:DUF2493 domain-containing protein [Acidimicrobiales bacterium]
MRILVTGSRDWADEPTVWHAIDDAIHDLGADHNGQVAIVHGACPTGADAIADRIAIEGDCRPERHPANWSRGRKAGPERNAHMVSLGADICLAFIGDCTSPRCNIEGKHPSHGASGCADLAERAGIPTRRFYAH